MAEVRVVHARGDAFQRGVQVGKELADLIQASIEFYHRYLSRRGASSETLQDVLTPYLVAGETAYPESLAVLKGMSIGAVVPILELFAINAFEELEPLLESPEGELLFLQRKEGYVKPPIWSGAPASRCGSREPPWWPTTSTGWRATWATSPSSWMCPKEAVCRWPRPPSCVACRPSD